MGIYVKKHTVKNKHNKTIVILVTIGVVLLPIALFYLSPLSGYTQFYGKVRECGGWPVVVGGSGHPIYETVVPYYYTPPQKFMLLRTYIGVYCTPLEAEQHGFSASSKKYEAPELKKQNGDSYCLTATSPKSETAVQFPYCGQK